MVAHLDESVVNNPLIEATMSHIVENYPDHSDGAILIFLPGIQEINMLYSYLMDLEQWRNPHHYKILCLHSMLAGNEQMNVFRKTHARKIVLATNIAETSLTIPEVVFVIDTGRVREVRYEASSKMRCLVSTIVSRASAKQRWGRAGRVREGYCFTMYSRNSYENIMRENQEPEMLRSPLEDICLQILCVSRKRSVEKFLKHSISPPNPTQVTAAMSLLRDIGAVAGGETDSSLTPLGESLANMPLDVRLGKTLLFAIVFNIQKVVLPIVAGMSIKSPFLLSHEGKQREFASEFSDHVALYNLYQEWSEAKSKGQGAERRFCQDACVSDRTMKSIAEVCVDLERHIAREGFEQGIASVPGLKCGDTLLPSILSAGLQPSVLRGERQSSRGAVRWVSREGEVSLGKNSVLCDAAGLPSLYLVFNEKVRTGQRVFVREASAVPIMSIILFDGKFVVNHAEGVATAAGGWLRFTGKTRTLCALAAFRDRVQRLVHNSLQNKSAEGADEVLPLLFKLLKM